LGFESANAGKNVVLYCRYEATYQGFDLRQDPEMTAIPPTTEAATGTAAAERMRRHRQRRRDGLRCLVIELRETEIDELIRKGLLKPETRNDTSAIIDALYAHLDSTLDETS
jgi:hypothetical protein